MKTIYPHAHRLIVFFILTMPQPPKQQLKNFSGSFVINEILDTLNIQQPSRELSSQRLCTAVHLKYIYTVYLFIQASVHLLPQLYKAPVSLLRVFIETTNPLYLFMRPCIRGTVHA